MSTLAEIRNAAASLPERQQKSLLAFLARRLTRGRTTAAKTRQGLKAASHPPLDALPTDLSTDTRSKIGTLMLKRHATHR
jgi:hypothetical protein